MAGRERLYYHREVASNLALFNMIKIKYMDTPEIYKTLLAFLSDYDPVKFGNRERTMRYVRLLITDESLANCILMSLPDATPQTNTVVHLAPKQTLHAKALKLKSSKLAIKPKRTLGHLNPHHMKAGVSPIKSKTGNKFQGPCKKNGMSISVSNSSSSAITRPASIPGTRDSPAIITCSTSYGIKLKQSNTVPKFSAACGSKPVITRRHSQPSGNPIVRPWTQEQMAMDQSQLPKTTDAVLTQRGMTFPVQCGDYRLPVQYPQMPGIHSYFPLNNLLQWQQLSLMSQSGDMGSCVWSAASSESGLDLSVQTSTTQAEVENMHMKHAELQPQKVHESKLKRSSPNITPTSESDGRLNTKLVKLSLDSVPEKSTDGNNIGGNDPIPQDLSKTENVSPPIAPIEALQNLVSNIGPLSNSESDVDNLKRKVLNTDKNIPDCISRSSDTDVDSQREDPTSKYSTPGNSHGDGELKIDIPSRAFPYSQKINFPDGKYSVISFQGENKHSVSCSSDTFAKNESMLAKSEETEGPEHVIQRSHSMSDLFKTGGISKTDVGALTSIVTDTSKSQNSTTVKIKLNSCKSGKLLGELLRLQQIKGGTSLQSTSTLQQDGEKNESNLSTVKKNVVTQFYLKNGTSLNLQGSMAATKVVPGSPGSGALHIFNTGSLGQTFAIQAKPDFESNKISVEHNALLQTIKDRLQQSKRRAHSDSDLLAMKMSVDSEVATSSNVTEMSSCTTEHLSTDNEAVISDSITCSSSTSASSLLKSSQVPESSAEDDDVFTDDIVVAGI